MGKTVRKILGAALIIASLFLPPVFATLAGTSIFVSVNAVLQTVGALSLLSGFAPDLPTFDGARALASNLSIFSSPTAVRPVAFGRVGVAGQVLFRDNIENSGDTPDELLLILGLAGYPVTSLEKFWLNGELVFDGDSTTGPGAITTGTFADDLWVWFRTGEETSAAFTDIASLSSTWNAKTRILRGIPCIGIRLKVTEKLDGRLEPLAQIKGSKLYDPRLDSTVAGGSGAHRINDPTTWAFSTNPKLAELLYLIGGSVNGTRIFGMGKAAAAIDLENFASEANICEEQISVVAGGTINRYDCNGLLVPQNDHRNNLQQLLTASAGSMDASGGIYRTFAGAWRASSMTLTEEDIDGAPTEMQLQKDPAEEINIIGGAFADPENQWNVNGYPELRDTTSIAQLGENPKTLDLPFTTDHRQAQRIAKIEKLRANAARVFSANYWLRTIPLQPGDIVTQTYTRYGITAETFRVNFWGLEASDDRDGNRRLLVPLQLVEEKEAWFDWDHTTEEQTLTGSSLAPSMDRRPKLITLDGVPTFEGAVPPANPKVGWLWLDTDVENLFRWDGSAWEQYPKTGAAEQQVRLAQQYFSFAVASDSLAIDGRAAFRFKTDGRIVGFDIDGNEFEFAQPAFWWFKGQQTGVGDNYEVRLESNTSGSWDSGTAVGTWVALTADRTWYREVANTEADGLYIVESVFEIRSSTTTGDAGERRLEASADFKATVKVTT